MKIIKKNHSIMIDINDSIYYEYLVYNIISNTKNFKHFNNDSFQIKNRYIK